LSLSSPTCACIAALGLVVALLQNSGRGRELGGGELV
jgi:hypothetical protein